MSDSWRGTFELVTHNDLSSPDLDRSSEKFSPCGCVPDFGSNPGPTCCDERCINFATQMECSTCGPTCVNNRLLKRKFKQVEVRDVGPKGFGLFAAEDIRCADLVIEYLGEVISTSEMNRRIAKDSRDSHMYLMQLTPKSVVDSRYKGSMARFFNHSCEPNCILEVWTVNNRLRLAFFTIKPVSKGEELTIDYQWKLSSRKPTKCYCGTPSCRGFLEVLVNDEARDAISLKGTWTSCKEWENDVMDKNGQIIEDKLIGKYVKLWIEEDQQYLDTRVEASMEDGIFRMIDVLRRNPFAAKLNEPFANWYWLDESKEMISFKKKDLIIDTDDFVPPAQLVDSLEGSNTQAPDQSQQQTNSKILVERTRMRIRYSLASFLSGLDPDITHSKDDIISSFVAFTYKDFSLKGKLTSDRSKESDRLHPNSFELEVFGDASQIKSFRASLRVAHDLVKMDEQSTASMEKQNLLLRQGRVFTKDWRVLPITSSTNARLNGGSGSGSGSYSLDQLIKLNQNILDSRLEPRRLIEWNKLPSVTCSLERSAKVETTSSDMAATSEQRHYSLSRSIEQSMLGHLRHLLRRAKVSPTVVVTAMTLLSRYLIYLDDSIVKEITVVITAICCIAMKGKGVFRIKHLSKLVKFAYCQVFAREEADVGSSADTLIPRVIDKEAEIFETLCGDVYVPVAYNLLETMTRSSNCTQQQLSLVSHLCEDSAGLLALLYSVYSVVLMSHAAETIQSSSFLLVVALDIIQRASVLGEMEAYPRQAVKEKEFLCFVLPKVLKRLEVNTSSVVTTMQLLMRLIEQSYDLFKESQSLSSVSREEFLDVKNDVECIVEQLLQVASKGNQHSASEEATLKTRLHPIFSNQGTVFQVSRENCVAIDKELATCSLAMNALESAGLKHLAVSSSSSSSSASSPPLALSLRSLPSNRSMRREMGKAKALGFSSWRLFTDELLELQILQHLSYTEPSLRGADRHAHILDPIGIATIVNTETEFADTAKAQSISPPPPESDDEDKDRDRTGDRDGGAQESALTEQAISFTRAIAFSPVLLSLSSMLRLQRDPREVAAFRKIVPYELSVQWCKELLVALDHMSLCGVVLRWIDPDFIYFTPEGKLLIGGLSGAVFYGSRAAVPAGPAGGGNSGSGSGTKHRAKAGSGSGGGGGGGSGGGGGGGDEVSCGIPEPMLHIAAPELILGGDCTEQSSVYSAGVMFCLLLNGKPLIKNGKYEIKQVEYVYKTLGTPQTVGYNDFHSLPFAEKYGRKIARDDGTFTESRSRVAKAFRSLCSAELLEEFSSADVSAADEGDNGGVVDLVKACADLVPSRRLSPQKLLALRLFKASEYPQTSFPAEIETLAHCFGGAVTVRGMSRDRRVDCMKNLVHLVRSKQWKKKDPRFLEVVNERDSLMFSCVVASVDSQVSKRSSSNPPPPPPFASLPFPPHLPPLHQQPPPPPPLHQQPPLPPPLPLQRTFAPLTPFVQTYTGFQSAPTMPFYPSYPPPMLAGGAQATAFGQHRADQQYSSHSLAEERLRSQPTSDRPSAAVGLDQGALHSDRDYLSQFPAAEHESRDSNNDLNLIVPPSSSILDKRDSPTSRETFLESNKRPKY